LALLGRRHPPRITRYAVPGVRETLYGAFVVKTVWRADHGFSSSVLLDFEVGFPAPLDLESGALQGPARLDIIRRSPAGLGLARIGPAVGPLQSRWRSEEEPAFARSPRATLYSVAPR